MNSPLSRRSLLAKATVIGLNLFPETTFALEKTLWEAAGSMNTPRDAFTILTAGKRITALGGRTTSRGSTIRSTETYNRANSLFTADTSMKTDRSFFPIVPLKNGDKVLAAAGFSSRAGTIRDAELFDMATGEWSETGSLLSARELFTATLLPNGHILAVGGFSNGAILASSEWYNADTGRWTYTKGGMQAKRHGHTAMLVAANHANVYGGKLMVMGGRTDNNVSLCATEVYDLAAGTWSAGPNMMQDRFRQTATTLQDGRILITGGYSSLVGNSLDTAEIYDPLLNACTVLDSKMSATRMDHTATLLPDGRVLLVGGWSSTVQNPDGSFGSTVASADLFDPATNTFAPTAPLPGSRHEHCAALVTLSNGMPAVLVAGGLHWEPASHQTLKDAWLYKP